MSLQVRGIGLERAGRPVLDGVSFDVAPSEIVAVVGANGAGKTSLLECVVGARRPTRGDIAFAGKSLATQRDRAAAIAYMGDGAEPPDEVYVAELLALSAGLGGTSPERAAGLREKLGLTPLLEARAGSLSRGEKRRVLLFAALCNQRPVVVLDEPLGVFDPLQLIEVNDVLVERARTGASVLLSVHQMSEAQKLAHRILLLDAGRVLAFGSFEALRAQAELPGGALEDVFLALLKRQHARA